MILRGDEGFILSPKPATEAAWNKEYLGMSLAIHIVDSVKKAIRYITQYESGYSIHLNPLPLTTNGFRNLTPFTLFISDKLLPK